MIDKPDVMELLNSMIKDEPPLEFTEKEMREVQLCLQLTPKMPSMYSIHHIENLFKALLTMNENQQFVL